MKIKLLLITVSILFTEVVFANIFTVTSNADSGPNTLRQAILDAATNGTSNSDTIIFQLPNIARAGRTITLLSELPALTSNLVIDGSTQLGTSIGVSDAKVIIQQSNTVTASGFTFLQFQNVSNIEIYGLYLFNSWWSQFVTTPNVKGIYFTGAKNIKIGAAGKGNYIRGTKTAAILSQANSVQDYSDSVYIQGNIIGNDETGGITTAGPISQIF